MAVRMQHKLVLATAGLAVLFVAVVALAGTALFRLRAANERVVHTLAVIAQLDRVFQAVLSIEASQRGYMIYGVRAYPEQFAQQAAAVRQDLAALRQLVADNPDQVERCTALVSTVDRWVELSRSILAAFERGGLEEARGVAVAGRTKALTDAIRQCVAAMDAEERRLLAERERSAATTWRVTLGLVGAILLGMAALVGFFIHATRRYLQERDRSERALRASAARFRALLEAVPDGLVVVNDRGTIVHANLHIKELFGYPLEALLGQAVEILVPEALRARHVQHREGFAAHASVRPMGQGLALQGRRADGSTFPLDVSLSPLRTEEGLVVIAAIRDITARKADADKLAAAVAELDDLYNRAPCGYHSLDADGRFVAINDTELGWLGYAREEVVGQKTFLDLVTPAGAEEFRQNFPRLKATGRVGNLRFEMICRDGRRLPVMVHATAVYDAAGRFLRTRSSVVDVTDLQRAEQAREAGEAALQAKAQQLADLNAELEAFSYSVSHDLRAPLRHIDGFADLLVKHLDGRGDLDDKTRRYVDTISSSARQMGQLIDDLLLFSRMARVTMHRERTAMADLVRVAVAEQVRDAPGREIRWAVEDLPVVHGDRAMLRQVWVNLLSNAVKYTRGRAPAEIRIGSRREGGEWVFFVADNGVGFDLQYRDRLFGVFSRLHTSAEFEGTGIGLANVRRIVDRHGGRTWADGRVDGGATFYFSLPAGEE